MKPMFIIAAFVATAFAGAAFASENGTPACGHAPKSAWMSKDAVTKTAEQHGYKVRRLKAEGNCYELYAIGPDGKKVEAYVNPMTAKIVGQADVD